MYWYLLIFTFILSSCISPLEKGEVSLDLKNVKSQQKPSPLVSNITLENDQLKISGSNFLSLTSVKIDSQNLSVISNDGSNLILSAPSAVMLALNSILNLVIETSYGATSVAVTFNLVDGSVTASKIGDGEIGANHLSGMGAGVGQVMQWNGTTWVPTDLSGLVYMGSWDATLSGVGPDAGSGTSAGEYYVVSNTGTVDVDGISSWAAGDWVVWNGTNWDKIDNSTGVTSFNGRAGTITPLANDYTWAQIDKTTSSVGDIADVDMTGVASGKILKWDGSKWAISDDLSSGGAGSVSSSEIQDGTIQASDLNAGLNTTLTQVGTNSTDIATNASDIATNAGNITTANSNIATNASNISTNTSNITSNVSSISTNTTNIASNTTAIGNKVDKTTTVNGQSLSSNVTLTTSNVGEGTNLYYTAARAKADAILNSTAGSETDQAASVAAMKSYVLAQTGAITGSQWTTSGSDIYYNAGNVGIGLTTPSEVLDVDGSIGLTHGKGIIMRRNTSGSKIEVLKIPTGTDNLVMKIPGSTNLQSLSIQNTSTAQLLTIKGDGNVGVGTSSPLSAFHIKEVDDSWNSSFRMDRSWDSSTDYFQMMYDYQGLKFRTMADGSDEAHIIFKPKDTEAMRITENGNIAIGLTTPTEKLTVAGKINVTAGNDFCIDGGTCLTTVAAGSGETNTASSAGGASLVLAKSGVNLPFKGLTATSDIALTQNANDIQIGVGATNGASQLLRLDASGKIPAVDGSLITNIPNDTLSTILTGLIPGSDTVLSATDSVLGAFENLQAQISATRTIASTNDTDLDSKVDKTTTVNGKALSSNVTLVTTDVAEGTNLYYTTARAKADTILNSTAGSETDQGASVAAMKSYVTTSIAGNGVWAKSGSDISYSSGKVGIGTSSPDDTLNINGVLRFDNSTTNNIKSPTVGAAESFRVFMQDDTNNGNPYGTSNNSAIIFENQDGNNPDPDDGVYFINTGNDDIPSIAMSISGAGKVGVGKALGVEALDVVGNINVTGALSVAAGDSKLVLNGGGGSLNSYSPKISLIGGTAALNPGVSEISMGENAGSFFRVVKEIGGSSVTEFLRVNSLGNLGVGATAPAEKLDVAGNVIATAYLYSSDYRFKTNIVTIDDSLDKVNQLRGVTFDWRNDEFPERNFPKEKTIGFIAQEVEEVAPELVKTASDGYKSVQYGNITALLVEAVKTITSKIDDLFSGQSENSREIASLKAQNEQLRKDMEEMKKSLNELRKEK